MPQVDYAKLAAQHGGKPATAPQAAPPVDYAALARESGGVPAQEKAPKTLGGLLSNAVTDIGNQVSGVIGMVRDLPGTARAMLEAKRQYDEDAIAAATPEAQAQAVANFKARGAGPATVDFLEGLADRVYQEPVTAVTSALALNKALTGGARPPAVPPKPPAPKPTDPVTTFAQQRGVPLSAGQATGNPVAKAVEQANEKTSIGGSVVAGRARKTQTQALTRVGNEIAGQVSKSPVSPEQAGQGLRDTLTQRATALDNAADAAYSKLRQFEAQAAQTIQQTGGIRAPATSARPFTNVPLAVDVAPTKAAMRSIYEDLLRKKELTGSLMGHEARMVTRLDALMNGPDLVPLSTADAVLSDFKALSRVDDAFRRTTGQGIAAQAVKNLDREVVAAARQGGPDVFRALMDGRASTINKYKTITILDKLKTEPVEVFRQATRSDDTTVGLLRELDRMAPGDLAKVGRAWVDDALSTATADGGFNHAQRLLADWEKLGPATKAKLFGPRTNDLDAFFRLAKRTSENVNPSGSGFLTVQGGKWAFIFASPGAAIPIELTQTALTAALWNPTIVRLMTRAMVTPRQAVTAASSVSTQLARALARANLIAQTTPAGAVAQAPATNGADQ